MMVRWRERGDRGRVGEVEMKGKEGNEVRREREIEGEGDR